MRNFDVESVPVRRGASGIAILFSRDNRIVNDNTVSNGPYSGIGIYSQVDSAHPRSTTGVSNGDMVEGNVVDGDIQARSANSVVDNDNIGIRLEPGNLAELHPEQPGEG